MNACATQSLQVQFIVVDFCLYSRCRKILNNRDISIARLSRLANDHKNVSSTKYLESTRIEE